MFQTNKLKKKLMYKSSRNFKKANHSTEKSSSSTTSLTNH